MGGALRALVITLVLTMGTAATADAAGVDRGGTAGVPATRIPNPLRVIGVDCLPDLDADTLTARLRDRIGPLRGFDNPKLVPLGNGRTLWLLTDPYVDLSGRDDGPLDATNYVHNTLLLQEGTCFSLIQRVVDGRPWEFAPSHSDRD